MSKNESGQFDISYCKKNWRQSADPLRYCFVDPQLLDKIEMKFMIPVLSMSQLILKQITRNWSV